MDMFPAGCGLMTSIGLLLTGAFALGLLHLLG